MIIFSGLISQWIIERECIYLIALIIYLKIFNNLISFYLLLEIDYESYIKSNNSLPSKYSIIIKYLSVSI